MISKCANPTCLARFHYLHEGRIFNLEAGKVASDIHVSSTRRIEHYWLCEQCAQTLTVVMENGVVSTRPLHPALPKTASQEKLEAGRHIA